MSSPKASTSSLLRKRCGDHVVTDEDAIPDQPRKRAQTRLVILSGAPSEIPPCSRAALLRSSIPLRSTQNDTEGAQSKFCMAKSR